MADPLGPFEVAVLETVADEHGFDTAALRELCRRHHAHAASMPGIDELVYEWRRFLPYEPLVARTADAFHLAVEPSVWSEFGDQLGFETGELAALRALHDRQARRDADRRGDDVTPFDERAAMVLAR